MWRWSGGGAGNLAVEGGQGDWQGASSCGALSQARGLGVDMEDEGRARGLAVDVEGEG